MTPTFPFLTAFDPPGTGEGSLDPLGLAQIADRLGGILVPAVRERMIRIRFLTAMAVSALITQGLDGPADCPPALAWEWFVTEALVRSADGSQSLSGVPGTLVTRRAIDGPGYLDARSYLKSPRVFGFHGVYKRLAVYLGIVDVHLGPGPNAERLADIWARGMDLGSLAGARTLLATWTEALRRGLAESPPRTRPFLSTKGWGELAQAFHPRGASTREKNYLRTLLLDGGERRLEALPFVWELQTGFADDEFREETLHDRLEARAPEYRPLLNAIRSYEVFARRLQDAFDILKAEAVKPDVLGFHIPDIASDLEFARCVDGLHDRFEAANRALGDAGAATVPLQADFRERFGRFGEPMDARACGHALHDHHLDVQRKKDAAGKRPWFDSLGDDRIFVRHAFREPRRASLPERYVHSYRGWPIRRFHGDLS